MNQQDILNRYPRLVAHLICASLGYFTPESATNAIAAHKRGEPFCCEWYCDWAEKGRISVIEVGIRAIRKAVQFRHHHKGIMADYERAKQLVDHVRQGGEGPVFASWF